MIEKIQRCNNIILFIEVLAILRNTMKFFFTGNPWNVAYIVTSAHNNRDQSLTKVKIGFFVTRICTHNELFLFFFFFNNELVKQRMFHWKLLVERERFFWKWNTVNNTRPFSSFFFFFLVHISWKSIINSPSKLCTYSVLV